jgi:TIR domain
MDSTTIIWVIIIALLIIGAVAVYRRRRPLEGGGHRAVPPEHRAEPIAPAAPSAPPEEPRRRGEGLFPDQQPGAGPEGTAPPAEAPRQPANDPLAGGGPPPPKKPAAQPPQPIPAAPPPPPPPAPTDREESAPGAEPTAAPSTGAAIPTEAVRFTAFHPKEAAVETWYTLLVYAHVETALSKVQADAARFKDEMGGTPREVRSTAPAQLARGTEISIVPACDGVTFNPDRVTLKWVEDVHRADFRFRASKDLADSAANILISIFVGPLLVATIKGGILFSAQANPSQPDNNAQTTTSLYRSEQIFPSYSHKDEDVVIACRNAYKALGFDFLRDRDTLRPGEDWNATLMKMIDQADIFQLFWSPRSAASQYCRQEWEYALKQSKDKGGAFIRPVYWEEPLTSPPPELSSLHFAFVPLAKP